MKLAPLLARYLYTHHRMELPGLGSFKLDPHSNSNENTTTLEGVTFESNPSIREAPQLITFISAETGKMKALAAADLNSHLELAHQFLNIGKPFMFEGIGNVVKMRNGEFAFTPGPIMPEAVPQKESREGEGTEESRADYKNIFYSRKVKGNSKKAISALLGIAGIAFALWGGYTVYKRSANNNNIQEVPAPVIEQPVENNVIVSRDTIQHNNAVIPASAPISSENRKFVLETASAKRAFARYNKLKSFQWNVEMETSDSVQYKLYVLLPVSAIDTTRILDSLTRMNGRRVHVE